MKKFFLINMLIFLSLSLLTGCGKPGLATPNTTESDSTVSIIPKELLDLRFDGYENMSISEYRKKAINIIAKNEVEYLALIERVSIDNEIQDIRYTNADAYFIANILIPTISEKWSTWRFSASATGNDYLAEYTISYSILDANNITVGERNQSIAEIMDSIQETLNGRTPEQLANETDTKAELDTEINKLITKYNTDSFQLQVELSYRVDSNASPIMTNPRVDIEERGAIGTKADYQLLLSLKTNDYKDKPVSDFFNEYAESTQNPRFQEACTNVFRDISCKDMHVDISEEDFTFLEITLEATSQEFISQYQDSYELPTLRYRVEEQNSETFNGQDITVFELFIDYTIEYSIINDTMLTIGERDTILISIQNEIQSFINAQTKEALIDGKLTLEAECERLNQQYSNDMINVNINILDYQAHDKRDDIPALQ